MADNSFPSDDDVRNAELDAHIRDLESQHTAAPDAIESSYGISNLLNTIPGATRAAVQTGLEATGLKAKTQPLNLHTLAQRAALASVGEYPPSSDIYGLNGPVGFAADVAQDPTGPIAHGIKAGAAKLGTMATESGLNALRTGESAAMDMPVNSTATLRERLASALNSTRQGLQSMSQSDWASNPIGKSAEAVGDWLHGSRLQSLDKDLPESMPKATDTLLEHGIVSTARGLPAKVQGVLDQLEQKNMEILSKSTAMSTQGVMGNGLSTPATSEENMVDIPGAIARVRSWIAPYTKDPAYLQAANQLEPVLAGYEQQGPLSINQATALAKRLKPLARSGYDGGADATLSSQAYANLRRAVMTEIENSVAKVDPQSAALMRQNNLKMYSLIESLPKADKLATATKFGITPSDVATSAVGGYQGGIEGALRFYLAKKAAEGVSSPLATTSAGLLMNRAGQLLQYPGAEAALRQSIVHSGTPWSLFPNGSTQVDPSTQSK